MVYCFVVEQTLYYYWDYKGGKSAGTNSGEQGLYDLWGSIAFRYLLIRQEADWIYQNLKNGGSLFCHCTRLSLSLNKIGGGSAIANLQKLRFFILSLHSPFAIF